MMPHQYIGLSSHFVNLISSRSDASSFEGLPSELSIGSHSLMVSSKRIRRAETVATAIKSAPNMLFSLT